MTIVSIRATHGAGKSSIVTKIMDKYGADPVEVAAPGQAKFKVVGYHVLLPGGAGQRPLFIVGPYKTACGGCDAIQPYSDILPLVRKYADRGWHVLLEGALVSSSYGSVGHLLNEYAPDSVFAFLDTPLEECLARIARRRAAKGNFEPVNPKNTTVKFENVARTKDQMARLGSAVRIVDLDHRAPVKGVLKLFGVNLREEPK